MPEWRRTAVALAAALALGAATSFLQTVLPYAVAPVANSAGTWCSAAFVLAGLARSTLASVALAPAALMALVAGYYVTADLRGFGVSAASIFFWTVAALVVGPALGLGRAWLRARGAWAIVGALALPALLVAEGVRSLLVIASTTSSAYWTAEVVVGLALGAVLLRSVR